MADYEDYQDILLSYNFVGGAGQGALPNSSSDDRAEVIKDGNGTYQFYYLILSSLTDMDNLGYYDTANNDIGNDGIYDREYNELPTGNDPGVVNANQLSILSSVLNGSTYSVTFSDVAKVNFNSGTTSTADIVIGSTTSGGQITNDDGAYEIDYTGNQSVNNIELKHGDIWLNSDATNFWGSDDIGSIGYWAIQHEIAHSLGLDHTDTTPAIDSQQYSIMSYNLMAGMNPTGVGNEVTPFGLQLLDIAALQEIYGRNYDTRTGDTTYSASTAFASERPNDAFIYTIWDGDGTDTVDASSYTNSLGSIIDLRQGEFSSIGYNAEGGSAQDNVAIAYHAIIENAVGTSNGDILIGNAWNNNIQGGDGNDRIFGDGLTLDDDSVVGQIYDNYAGYGTGTGEHDSNNPESGPASDDSGDDTLDGGAGNDYLYGGAGVDTLIGEIGDDHLYGGVGEDTFVYNFGDGDDVIYDIEDGDSIEFGANVYSGGLDIQESGDDLVLEFSDGGSISIVDGATLEATDIDITTPDVSGNMSGRGGLLIGSDIAEEFGGWFSGSYYGYYYWDPVIAFGRGGNDWLGGQASDDYLDGGDGDDIINAWGGSDIIIGGSGNDSIVAKALQNGSEFSIDGGYDDDSITVGALNSAVFGTYNVDLGYGDDTFTGYVGTNETAYIQDVSGSDTYSTGNYGGSFEITDYLGNDTYVYLSGASLQIADLAGSDTYQAWAGADYVSITDSGGTDKLEYVIDNISQFQNATQVGNDLHLDAVYANSITIVDYFVGTSNKIEQVKFKDTDYFDLDLLINSTNVVFGTTGDDSSLSGNSSDNTILAFSGNDTLIGGAGNDTLDGGDGSDTADYSAASAAVVANLSTSSVSDGDGGTDTLSNIENITGSAFDDDLRGDGLANIIHGGDGNDFIRGLDGGDTLYGDAGNDELIGDNGNDTLHGGTGNDTLTGKDGDDILNGNDGDDILNGQNGSDTIDGGAGDDVIQGNAGSDTIDGGADTDIVTYENAAAGIVVDLGASGTNVTDDGDGSSDSLINVENIKGSAYADSIAGDSANNTLYGENGDDTLYGSGGSDILYGGAGTDTIDYSGASAGVIVHLGQEQATDNGSGGADELYEFENIVGTAYDDDLRGNGVVNVIHGGDGDDYIRGLDGGDYLYGDAGNDELRGDNNTDYLYGGDGNDILSGKNGDDFLYGGDGLDILGGGAGADIFFFEAASAFNDVDQITDFNTVHGDAIDISDLLSAYDPLNDAITDFVWMVDEGSNTAVYVDQDGTGTTEAWAKISTLSGVTGLTDEAALETSGNLITA